jgi:hypothetical protein
MPRAPPTSRAVSLTAEATPCLDGGSELTMAVVAGVMARPMPTETIIIPAKKCQ